MVEDFRMSLGRGDAWIGVPVRCYTPCNINLLDICILIYLNDILIYSDNSVDYEKHVCEVLLHL